MGDNFFNSFNAVKVFKKKEPKPEAKPATKKTATAVPKERAPSPPKQQELPRRKESPKREPIPKRKESAEKKESQRVKTPEKKPRSPSPKKYERVRTPPRQPTHPQPRIHSPRRSSPHARVLTPVECQHIDHTHRPHSTHENRSKFKKWVTNGRDDDIDDVDNILFPGDEIVTF